MVDNGMGEKTQTKIPINVLRYMPIVPRLQRLFMVEETARQMTWHKTGKRTELDADGNLMIVHTSDGVALKQFDELHGDKAADPRHPRVGISTDGFSVFGMTAAQYSCCPYLSFHSISPRTDYAKKEHFPDVDNSRAKLSGEKYECVHAAA